MDVDTGQELGAHKGAELYTIGQKARIQGQRDKYYVVGRGSDHSVLVAAGADHPRLFFDYLMTKVNSFVWVQGAIKLRYF